MPRGEEADAGGFRRHECCGRTVLGSDAGGSPDGELLGVLLVEPVRRILGVHRDEEVVLVAVGDLAHRERARHRSEEHTSELQSLMRISYAVFCLKKKSKTTPTAPHRSFSSTHTTTSTTQ